MEKLVKLLTPENTISDLNIVNENTDNTFSILDCNNKDWFFQKFFMFQEFISPTMSLKIDNKYLIELPLNWQVLTADPDSGELAITNLEQLTMFEHYAFCINPLNSFFPTYHTIEVVNIYSQQTTWFVPRLLKKHLLGVVFNSADKINTNPMCIYVSDSSDKINDIFHIADIF